MGGEGFFIGEGISSLSWTKNLAESKGYRSFIPSVVG